MNTYRVDRAREGLTPCGMNSILYMGDSAQAALDTFHYTTGGKNTWNSPDPTYGVMLSIWDPVARDYRVKRWKS